MQQGILHVFWQSLNKLGCEFFKLLLFLTIAITSSFCSCFNEVIVFLEEKQLSNSTYFAVNPESCAAFISSSMTSVALRRDCLRRFYLMLLVIRLLSHQELIFTLIAMDQMLRFLYRNALHIS